VSQRAIRRGQQRREAAKRRKEQLRRRRAGLAVTAALGATALFAPGAHAANFEVNSLNDGTTAGCDTAPDGCTLRDAIDDSNTSGEADTITFASALSGNTITLTDGQLTVEASAGGLAIQGPGAGNLTISGDSSNKDRLFNINRSGNTYPVSIAGLTLTNGYRNGSDGGAIYTDSGTDVTVSGSVFTNNQALGGSNSSAGGNGGAIGAHGTLAVNGSEFHDNLANRHGGAVFVQDDTATLRNTTVTGNTAHRSGGGVAGAKYQATSTTTSSINWFHSNLDIADSTISGNKAGYGGGGGIDAPGLLTLARSSVSGNDTTLDGANTGSGGGIVSSGKYAQTKISDSTVTGNTAGVGGGISVSQFYKYSESDVPVKHAVQSSVKNTTISGNKAASAGGGLAVGYLADGDHFLLDHSTISGNDAASGDPQGFGGGIAFASNNNYQGPIDGEFQTSDSTISGNAADIGGGVSVGAYFYQGSPELLASSDLAKRVGPGVAARFASTDDGMVVGPEGSIDFANSTIASNTAATQGGGVYMNQYHSDPYDSTSAFSSPAISLTSTILADNIANGAANDADRGDNAQGGFFDAAFSLIENPGDEPIMQNPAGSSLTGVDPQLGALGDNGGPTQTQLPSATSPAIDKGKAPARLITDQRGHARTVFGDVIDAPGGDGTDIGAVEVDNPAKNVVGGPITPADEIAPKITLKVPKSLSIAQLIAGFNVRVTCNEACAMTFRLYGSAPTGTLHSAGYNFRLLNRKIGRKGGTRRVHLRPCVAGSSSSKRTHVCRKRITAALFAKPQKTFKVKLIVAAKDKAGNISHVKRFIRVHR
jgi:hypothetical protein